MTFVKSLLNNSGIKKLNLDGSVTASAFFYSPPVGLTLVKSLTCLLVNPGSSPFNSFYESLAKGLVIKVRQGTQTSTLMTIKDKSDLLATFKKDAFYIVSPNMFMGTLEFDALGLPLNIGDALSVVVQDDLRGIESLTMSCILSR